MRLSSSKFLSSLAAVLAASAATVSAQSPASLPPPPQFTAILTGQINATYHNQAAGPFGTRIHVSTNLLLGYDANPMPVPGHSGSLANATTGEAVADILSFSNNGVLSAEGMAFPSVVMPLTWSTDGHFASVSMEGVRRNKSTHIEWTYAHVETDSPTYSWMNGRFFIMQLDSSQLPSVSVTMYEEMN